MSSTDGPSTVRNDPAQSRLVSDEHGPEAELFYEVDGDRLLLLHTEVPELLRGQGVGAELVTAAVALALARDLTVVPWCPYARRWLRQHPDVADTVTIDWTTAPPDA